MPDQTRLLVVDDDADIRELLSAYLARYDMTVETAADGAGLFERLCYSFRLTFIVRCCIYSS